MAGGMTRIRRRLLAGLCKGMALAATMTAMPATAAPAAPVRNDDLALVQKHIRAVTTLTASFTQTDARGQTQSGTFLWKQPGQIRFQYGGGVPLLIVADGRALTMIDYEVRQVQRWPIRNSPLGALLDPTRDVTRYGKVVETGDPRSCAPGIRRHQSRLHARRAGAGRSLALWLGRKRCAGQPDGDPADRQCLWRAHRRFGVQVDRPATQGAALIGLRCGQRVVSGGDHNMVTIHSSAAHLNRDIQQGVATEDAAGFPPCYLPGFRRHLLRRSISALTGPSLHAPGARVFRLSGAISLRAGPAKASGNGP